VELKELLQLSRLQDEGPLSVRNRHQDQLRQLEAFNQGRLTIQTDFWSQLFPGPLERIGLGLFLRPEQLGQLRFSLPKCFDFLCGQQSRPELQEDLSFSPSDFPTIQPDSIQ
jgi:hypothetical protein